LAARRRKIEDSKKRNSAWGYFQENHSYPVFFCGKNPTGF